MSDTIQHLVRIAFAGLVLTSAACLTSIGPCSSEEAAAVNAVEHYGGAELEPKNDGLGHCGATFVSADDPSLVIEHYRSKLEAAGWTVDPPQPGLQSSAERSRVQRCRDSGMPLAEGRLSVPHKGSTGGWPAA